MTEGEWRPTEIVAEEMQEFAEWLNVWGDVEKRVPNEKANAYERGYEAGYHRAIKEVYDRIGLDFVQVDDGKKSGDAD